MDSLPISAEEGDIHEVVEYMREIGWSEYPIERKTFYQEYLKSYNRKDAALCVGISVSEAQQWLRDPIGNAFMSDLTENSQIRTNITEDFVRTMWMNLLPKLMGEEDVPMVTPQGDQITVKKFEPNATVAALREISKSTKFYEDGSGQGGINLQLLLQQNVNITAEQAAEEYMKAVNGSD